MPWRKVPRDVNEEARDVARALMGTPEFETSRDERKRVEMRFAHLKTHHRFERLRLRGLTGARDEFHLAAIVQNLKTLAHLACPSGINRPRAISGDIDVLLLRPPRKLGAAEASEQRASNVQMPLEQQVQILREALRRIAKVAPDVFAEVAFEVGANCPTWSAP